MSAQQAIAAKSNIIPKHIAIVMDGNGRWAKKRLLPVAAGHKAGAENVRSILEACQEIGVQELTLFAFSSENWQRPPLEVKALMTLFSDYLDRHIEELHEKGVRMRFIGARERFSPALMDKIHYAETLTQKNIRFVLTLAVDYGGQWDITRAAQRIAEDVEAGKLSADQITTASIENYLSLNADAYPDLFIRTSGEYRISNFLLWQIAYSELYFTDVLWPDFSKDDLLQALKSFSGRSRRFGRREE